MNGEPTPPFSLSPHLRVGGSEGAGLRLEARCLERSLLVRLRYGTRGPDHLQWELYLGGRRLDTELARMGRFRLEDQEDSLQVEIPLHGPGMVFEVRGRAVGTWGPSVGGHAAAPRSSCCDLKNPF